MSFLSRIFLVGLFLSLGLLQLGGAEIVNAQEPPPPTKGVLAGGESGNAKSLISKEADYSKEAFVIEQIKTLIRFDKDGTGQREVAFRARIQSDAGVQAFGQLVLPYSSSNENLMIDKISVQKSDGSTVVAGDSDVQDLTAPITHGAPVYTDLRQKHVTIPGLRPGDVLTYHLTWKVHTPLAPNQFWLEHNFIPDTVIVLDEQLEVNVPVESKIKLKTEKGIDPVIKEVGERRTYTWKRANLKREDEDEKAESKKKSSDDPKPQIQLTTFQSWSEIGQWYAGLQRDRIVPDGKIKAKASELLNGLTNDTDKIKALYEFVAKNYRYVSLSLGQARYQPHAAADVFSNQYGDCKDKHTLLSAMLNAAGFHAYPVLINSWRKLDADVPSPAQFDHVITAIQVGKEMFWVDTTAEVAPFRLLSPQLRNKQALLIPEDSPARLEMTPSNPPFPNTEAIEIEGKVDDFGKLNGHIHLTLRGDSEMLYRISLRQTPKSSWSQTAEYLAYRSGLQGKVKDIKAGDPGDIDKPYEVEYDFSIDGFLDWSSKKSKLKILLPSFGLSGADIDDTEDAKPIELGAPGQLAYKLKLSLPAKYQLRIPVPVSVTRDYADYKSSYKLEGTTLIAERTLSLRNRDIPAARAQDYTAFVSSTRTDAEQTLSIEGDGTGSAAIPDTVKVEELIEAANKAVNNGNYSVAEDMLRRAVVKEPKHKTVRRELAYVLFVEQKFDSAIQMVSEQTKINPFDDYCYTLLGRIYWRLQKYSDSETAFRKQLEIAPLDKFARANLGQMLVEARKYKEAVPELEQAISLNPEAEFLHVSLGTALLNLNETQKAIEAFDQAVKLAPGPTVWNDIAYNLSLHKVELGKARQYAESAVTQVATELRNVELDKLKIGDLRTVGSIAANLDTLGWVLYQDGDIDQAEKYCIASWRLAQHGEVGYHVGQILEKRGRTADAMTVYALAASASRQVPEARESLTKLAGAANVEAMITKSKLDLIQLRTVKLGSLLKNEKEKSEAEFYVVLVPGPTTESEAVEVKFIRGNQKLQSLTASLKSAKYELTFPNNTNTRIIRRGTLTCQPNGGECSFVMMASEDITSVD